ncbi:hypothetical protein JB92DRAFT_2852661 [Gautieria morchelliformis]|nr:hypothetical protein JB92DRAFT_2852661 [Gautieria morchelliformis]
MRILLLLWAPVAKSCGITLTVYASVREIYTLLLYTRNTNYPVTRYILARDCRAEPPDWAYTGVPGGRCAQLGNRA